MSVLALDFCCFDALQLKTKREKTHSLNLSNDRYLFQSFLTNFILFVCLLEFPFEEKINSKKFIQIFSTSTRIKKLFYMLLFMKS